MEQATAFVLIKAKPGHEHEVYYSLAKRDKFKEIHSVMGEYSIVAKVVADDLNQIGNLVRVESRRAEHVESYSLLLLSPM